MSAVERVLELAHKMGYTQASLAEKLNEFGIISVKKQTITDWKSGKSNSYLFLLKELSQLFNVTTDFILSGKNSITDLTSNEKEILRILNKLELETDQAKLIGYADCYADKILNDKLTAMHPNSDKKYNPEIAAYGGGKVEAEPLSEIEMIEIAQKFDDM